MVYGIVKQHGGYIGVRSGEGQGTTFDLYLPCASPTEDTRAEQAPERGGEVRGSETILLVEDEADVRELTREILEMAGYTVLEAARGDEALRLCLDAARSINLLLTDVVMPQMSGPELARKMLELRPGTKVVYMSGYTDDALGHHGVLDPDIILLPKPFTPEALMQHLRLALGRIREARLAQRTFRVPRTTGASGSITKRMRGRSVSEVETLAEIGVVNVIGVACHAAASNRLTWARPRAALCRV